MPDLPPVSGGILGAGGEMADFAREPGTAESGSTAGGVGDSPVRGTLVENAVVGEVVQRGDGVGSDASLAPAGGAALSVSAPGPRPLRTSESRHLSNIAKVDRRVHRKAQGIIEAALRAPDLADLPRGFNPSAHEPPPGWTRRGLKIAIDANQPMKVAPAYIGLARQTLDSYQRATKDREQAPVLNAEIVQVTVNQQYNYPVRVLDED